MKLLRKLLFPFSIIYGGVTALRNLFYNKGWLKSKAYNFPVICVGNLSTGGTGKSPMIEFLVSFLKDNHNIAVLSRGYKRKTSGYHEVFETSIVEEVGDEPLQFKKKYPQITVAVCEDRQTGINKLADKADVILLDDAFQHRKVKASLNILLTSFDDLYIDDCVLPAGNLREPRFGAKRANIIVVTKCPDSITKVDIEKIKYKLKTTASQEIYFSKIGYGSEIKNSTTSHSLDYLKARRFLLVTGIANPKPLVDFLKNKGMKFETKEFSDHHNFTDAEFQALKKEKLIITTEKDFMRLQTISDAVEIYYLPIKTVIIDNAEADFIKKVEKFL